MPSGIGNLAKKPSDRKLQLKGFSQQHDLIREILLDAQLQSCPQRRSTYEFQCGPHPVHPAGIYIMKLNKSIWWMAWELWVSVISKEMSHPNTTCHYVRSLPCYCLYMNMMQALNIQNKFFDEGLKNSNFRETLSITHQNKLTRLISYCENFVSLRDILMPPDAKPKTYSDYLRSRSSISW